MRGLFSQWESTRAGEPRPSSSSVLIQMEKRSLSGFYGHWARGGEVVQGLFSLWESTGVGEPRSSSLLVPIEMEKRSFWGFYSHRARGGEVVWGP